jgi:hypothetical protein
VHLFLDFDGVLHPFTTEAFDDDLQLLRNPALFCWLPVLADLLRPYPSVKIIVSSDWRRLYGDSALAKLLGNELGPRFDGVTATCGADRAKEIREEVARRQLERWIALDDHPSVRAARKRDKHFIWCDPTTGVNAPDVQKEMARKLAA